MEALAGTLISRTPGAYAAARPRGSRSATISRGMPADAGRSRTKIAAGGGSGILGGCTSN
jgi:hypothetical protein